MKYKKLLCAVLALVLLLALSPAAHGVQAPALCLTDAQVSAGDSITLTVSIESNPDSTQISPWAKVGLYWAVYHDILCGADSVTLGTALSPNKPADRAQIAVMIVRSLQQ